MGDRRGRGEMRVGGCTRIEGVSFKRTSHKTWQTRKRHRKTRARAEARKSLIGLAKTDGLVSEAARQHTSHKPPL